MYSKFASVFSMALDRLEGRQVYRCRRVLEKTQWMKRDDLQKLKFKRLKSLLIHAYDNVPYYHEAFRSQHFKPDDFKSMEDLRKVPVLTKSAVRENLENMIARNVQKEKLIWRETSGTTATPVKFCRSRMDESWGIGAELRAYSWAGYELGDKLALIWRYTPEQNSKWKFKLVNYLTRKKILNVYSISEKSMEEFLDRMEKFRPKFIRGLC